jgi:hypothetical protein
MVITTATTESVQDPRIRAALAEVLKEMDHAHEMRMKMAIENGELSADTDVTGRARLVAATMHSLSIRARAGESRRSLESMARSAARVLAADMPDRSRRSPS